MSVPKKRPQPGPGAPLTAEREQYRRLMAQGLNNNQACLIVGVNPTTGMRWSKGRNMVDHTGKARYYPPIHAEPVAISPRYLSEEERILIGDLLAAGHTQRSVAAQLRRSPSTISREIRRNISGAGNYRPFGAHRKALARRPRPRSGKLASRQRVAGLRPGQARAAVEPAADLPRTTDRVPRPDRKASGARNHLPGPLRAGTRRTATGAGPGAADRAGPAQAAPPRRRPPARQHRRPVGDDQRASRRGRRPRSSRPLGRRPDNRGGQPSARSAPWSSGPPAT